jgi:HPt (histidine-containing phosphotransfer) domain-containing protein
MNEPTADHGAERAEPQLALDPEAVSALIEMTGDREFAQTLMDEFVDDTTRLLQRIAAAAHGLPSGREQLREEAHRLKSSAAIVGASVLSARARRLETAADPSDPAEDDALRQLAEQVATAAQAAFAAIERHRIDDVR